MLAAHGIESILHTASTEFAHCPSDPETEASKVCFDHGDPFGRDTHLYDFNTCAEPVLISKRG